MAGWINLEARPVGDAEVDRNPIDDTYLILWRQPHAIGFMLTEAQMQDLIVKMMRALDATESHG